MRRLAALLLAFGVVLGVAGSALAECGASHADSGKPAPQQPQPQT